MQFIIFGFNVIGSAMPYLLSYITYLIKKVHNGSSLH